MMHEEYTSHRFPNFTRVQFQTPFKILGAFVVREDFLAINSSVIWTLVDEAVAQNARYANPKPSKFFAIEFCQNQRPKYFELVPVSEYELKIRRRFWIPYRLIRAARILAARRIARPPIHGSS